VHLMIDLETVGAPNSLRMPPSPRDASIVKSYQSKVALRRCLSLWSRPFAIVVRRSRLQKL